MNLKELKWPVRVYWDLPDEQTDTALVAGISGELIALKILFLSLGGPSTSACKEILATINGRGMAVSLTLPGDAVTPQLPASMAALGVRTLLCEFTSLKDATEWFEPTPSGGGASPGLSFDVSGTNFHEIPDLVSFCLRKSIRDLVFPIQRLIGNREVFCLTGQMREGLAAELKGLDYSSLRITIHDPFLWQVFFPDADYHEGGCQAANSMLYIGKDLKVYPCPAMPLELGDLRRTPLREIILSDKKKVLRESLQSPPGDCVDCGLAVKCLGGCRGRALAAVESLDRSDPACDGP